MMTNEGQPSLTSMCFGFQCEDPSTSCGKLARHSALIADEEGSAERQGNVMFFSVQQSDPVRAELVHGSHHVDTASLLRSPLRVLSQPGGRGGIDTLTIALEGDDGKASDESLVFGRNMLCVSDMYDIKRWKRSGRLKYTFPNMDLPTEHEKPLQAVMNLMFNSMATRTSSSRTPTASTREVDILPSSDRDGSKRRCREYLENCGYVGNKASTTGFGPRWFFTQKGRSLITVGFDISCPRPIFHQILQPHSVK